MNKTKFIIIFLVILLLASFSAVFLLYTKIKNTNAIPDDPKGDSQKTIKSVSKIFELPEGETPTVATIMSMEELKYQPFFARAKIGDKVLIYQKSLKVILWRPSTGKIIEISTLGAPEENNKDIVEEDNLENEESINKSE